MTDTFKLVRVFLASPGDLVEERRLVKDTEEEINSGIGAQLGFRIELRGWEDTLSSIGRPQAVINKDLDQCELFIGMMSRKWGTPPSKKGDFTSGFEEEFERSIDRNKKTGMPEMALYFKKIDTQFLTDPGEDLGKVLDFQKKIQSEKSIYYESFDDIHELQKRVRLKIQEYLFDLNNSEVNLQEEDQAKTKTPEKTQNVNEEKEKVNSPFSVEGHGFLKDFIEKTGKGGSVENISSFEVARFRLLASVISRSNNDDDFLGVHDANIIYLNRSVEMGRAELSSLIDCGLSNLEHENAPLWHWYSLYAKKEVSSVWAFRSLRNDNVGIGSLNSMIYLGVVIEKSYGTITRDLFVKSWFSEKSPDDKKIAALNYLKEYGLEEDLEKVRLEYDLQNSKTSKVALEAIVSIQMKLDRKSAIKTILDNQLESFDKNVLDAVTSFFSTLDRDFLSRGLSHRNKFVRLESLKNIKNITSEEISALKKDPFSLVRKEIVNFLISSGDIIDDKEVRSILVKPKKTRGIGEFLSSSETDEEGEACYNEYLHEKLCKLKEGELQNLVEKSSIYNDSPYIALCDKYFSRYAEKLRWNIDNRFEREFNNYVEGLKDIGLPSETIKETQDLSEFVRQTLTRKALDCLCKKSRPEDIERIRGFIKSDFIGSSKEDSNYMKKWGEWSDIQPISVVKHDFNSRRQSILGLSFNYDWNIAVAETIYSIGKDRLEDLLQLDIDAPVSLELLRICSISKFSDVSEEVVLKLLNKKEANIRKSVALKSIHSFKKPKIKSILDKYTGSKDYRYYNAIFWLDFGCSMQKNLVNRAASSVLRGL